MSDDDAVSGEDGGYVPCGGVSATIGLADDGAAITGEDEGYVPVGTAAGSAPASSDDTAAVYGAEVGYVARPCTCVCVETFTRTLGIGSLGASEFCGDPPWVNTMGTRNQVTGSRAELLPLPFGTGVDYTGAIVEAPVAADVITEYLYDVIVGGDNATNAWFLLLHMSGGSGWDPIIQSRGVQVFLGWSPDLTVTIQAVIVDGLGTTFGTTPGVAQPFGSTDVRDVPLRVRVRIERNSPDVAMVRVWQASTPEPGTWDTSTVSAAAFGAYPKIELIGKVQGPHSGHLYVDRIEITEGCNAVP